MSSSPPTPAASAAFDRRAWITLLVVCGVLFLDGLDVSMVGVALPSIDADMNLSTSTLQWVVSGYVLGYGGFLLLGGRAADLLGRRRVLLAGLTVFAVASLAGALVDSGPLLIAARFIKGVSAGFTAPAGLSIVTTTFAEGPARNRALGIYTATGASGFSLGLVLGGLLTTAGWRWTFLLPVPIALLLLVLAARVLPHDNPVARRQGRFDVAGAVTVTGAMLALVFAVAGAPDAGWTSAQTLGAFATALVLGGAFFAVELRVAEPLMRLSLLRSPVIAGANVAGMTTFACYFGFQFIATLYMQQLLGWSALGTALAFLPAGLLVAFGAPRMGPLATRVGTAPLITAGLLSFVVGYALFLRVDVTPSYAVAILPTILLLGLGFALTYPAANMAATSGVPDHEQGLASGLVSTSFQLGGAVGLAIVTAVITAGNTGAADAETLLDEFRPGLAVVTGFAVLGLATVLASLLAKRRIERLAEAAA
jgi:EmrB/QacA subfamily drug resistance transporter